MKVDKYAYRVKVLGILGILVIIILILRLFHMQIIEGHKYSRLAEGNRIRIIRELSPRGNLYDRNGEPLVLNRPNFIVTISPKLQPIDDDVLKRLANLLNIPPEEIQEKIKKESPGFNSIYIKQDVSPNIIAIIEEQKHLYQGVYIEVQPTRDYILKEMGAHIFGYVSEINDVELEKMKGDGYKSGDYLGKMGLERVYDKYLRGFDGGRQVEVDVHGKPVNILGRKEPIPGADLYLTIDKNLQLAAEVAIDEQLKLIKANAAAAIALNPQTGEVLAMVSRPSFDPNLFARGISTKNWNKINSNPFHPMDNKVISGEYPPGSTFKIITGTAALATGKVTPEEKIFDAGYHPIIPKTNAAGEALGYINFKEAMAHSDNVYFYEMGNRLGIDELEKYTRMFGLGKETGIDLPYESDGLVASPNYKKRVYKEDWYLAETFDAAIGQGFQLVTPAQAAMVMAEIASGGKRYKPHLVSKIKAANGEILKEFKPEITGELSVSPEVIRIVQESLLSVTKEGTGKRIFEDFPVPIAGKTGTAENPHGRDHGWFVGYGPFDDPKIVVAVVVEQGGYGSISAAPIAKRILSMALIHGGETISENDKTNF